jgi:hypothetical protein
MCGIALPVKETDDITKATAEVILLGKKAVVAAGAITEEELKEVQWDGYVIKARDNRIALAGPRGRATLFGVAGFLEHLGARFYGTTEVVPKLQDLKIREFALADKPAFEFRRVNVSEWQLKTSYDDVGDPTKAANPELFTEKAGSNLWIDHTAGYLVPIKLYYDEHPEYYALVGGKRVACGRGNRSDRDVTPCLSNPDVIRISIERLTAWIEKQPERRVFGITYGDTEQWCQCENCKKLDGGHGRADRCLYWVNAVAREVGKKYPDKVFWTFAYGSSQPAPVLRKPEPNVIVMYTPWYGLSTICRRHSYMTCWQSIPGALEMEDWLKCSPGNLGVYDYSLGGGLQLRAYEDNIRFWGKRGYRGFWECGSPKGFQALEGFVKAKLLWNPSLDPAKLEEEFCQACYGPAGKHVAAFIEACYHEKVHAGTHKGRNDPQYPAKELSLLEEILKAAAGTPYEKQTAADLETFMKDYHGCSVPERKEKLKAYMADGNYAKDGLLPEFSPEQGFQGYEQGKLWLSKPKIARKGAQNDAELTQLTAICTQGPAGDAQAAKKMQEHIKAIYGIELPIENREIGKDTKGVIVVGRKAALASGLVTEEDFKAAGPEGVVVRGLNGRVAVAATNDEKVSLALEAFLYIVRSRHGGTKALGDALPKATVPIIREFSLIDWPLFGPVCEKNRYPTMR